MIYNSPLRKDKTPSFGCYYSKKTKQLMFKDHGTGECGNIIKFVSLFTGLTNYSDISTTTLKKFGVSSIKYYLCNGVVKGIYKDSNPMYAYKVYNNFKIYRPLADKYTKWRNNLTENDIQGFKQLPKTGDILIITKSMKDVMCLYEMGIPAISPSSESTFIPDKALNQLKKRFKRIIILFDRDTAGVKYLRKMSLKTGLEGMLVHKKFKAKDISDAVKLNGFETIKNWLYEEIY